MAGPPPQSSRSWSIYGRSEITERYEILDRIGSGAYSDVYRGRRLSDGLIVALKEIHDYPSSFREIEALQILRHVPNVVDLIEYFWQEEDDAVLVLEYLHADLAAVIRDRKKAVGLPAGEVKQWMLQILSGVDACHRNSVVHRDLKPSNLLISADGVLKLADFGQAIIIEGRRVMDEEDSSSSYVLPEQVEWNMNEYEYFEQVEEVKEKYSSDEYFEQVEDVDSSCLATCSTGYIEEDQGSCSYEEEESRCMTSCVGTRWFRAPELLYGCTKYGKEVDLWSLGCIFAELLRAEPLFPGTSDIDQIGRIIGVLGDFNEETSPGCSKLPDYNKIAFNKVESPVGLEACFEPSEVVGIVKKLVRYDPASRATASELLGDMIFKEEPLPVPLNQLKVPTSRVGHDFDEGDYSYRDMGLDSDFDGLNLINTDKGFSITFS